MFEGNQRLEKAEGHGTGTCPAPSARFPSPVNSGGGDPPSLSCKKDKFPGKQTSQNLVTNFNTHESYFSRKCSSSISSCPSENGGSTFNRDSNSNNPICSKDFTHRIIIDQEDLGQAIGKSVDLCQISHYSRPSSSSTLMQGDEHYIYYYQSITVDIDPDLLPGSLQTLGPSPINFYSSSISQNSERRIYLPNETLNDPEFEMKSISSTCSISCLYNFINIPPPQVLSCSIAEDSCPPISFAYGY